MIYPYEVKFNGEYYEAGEDVPDGETEVTESTETTIKKPTKTQINTMNKADLVEMARSVDIEDADDKSGTELKELLIEHYGL